MSSGYFLADCLLNSLVFSIFAHHFLKVRIMNKTQIVAAFAEKAGITKTDASKFFNALMGVMADNIVEGDGEISIPDFGRFFIKHVAERQGVNPATGEKITIAARDKVVFKASDSLPYFSRKHSNE